MFKNAIKKLTEEQQNAFDKILLFLKDKQQNMFLLSGYAGTGKTFLSIRLVEYLASNISNQILICAPTNKAVKVLRQEIDQIYLNTTFSTIHSALGLKEQVDGFGKIKFVPNKIIQNKIKGTNILILDEVSMLEDELFYYLISELKNNKKLKILFIGDEAQIPPINRSESIPFSLENQRSYNIGIAKLNKIVRQAEQHPIIELSDFVRKNLFEKDIFNKYSSGKIESSFGSIYFLDSKKDQDRFILLLNDLFNSNSFKEDGDFVKIIAWTNEVVNQYNELIRTMIFGESIPKIVPNEKLILDAPVIENNKIILNTNEEVEVVSYDIHILCIPGYPNMKYYNCNISLEDERKKIYRTINILHESSKSTYDNHANKLLKIAKSEKQGTFSAATKWKNFYKFQDVFAKVKYAYSVTAHKSQGSTYDNSFLIYSDIQKNINIKERNRLIYTGITRPRSNLFIIL